MENKTDPGREFGQMLNCGIHSAFWSLVHSKRIKFLFQKLHELHPKEFPPLEELDKAFIKEAQEDFSARFPLVQIEFDTKPQPEAGQKQG